jgi:hypothetical protein
VYTYAYTELLPVGYPMQAFNNRNNGNVARYFSSSMIEYDTFDTMQLKVVFLADDINNLEPVIVEMARSMELIKGYNNF